MPIGEKQPKTQTVEQVEAMLAARAVAVRESVAKLEQSTLQHPSLDSMFATPEEYLDQTIVSAAVNSLIK